METPTIKSIETDSNVYLLQKDEILTILDKDSQTKRLVISFDGDFNVKRQHKEMTYTWIND